MWFGGHLNSSVWKASSGRDELRLVGEVEHDRRLLGRGKIGERSGDGGVAIGRRVLVDEGGPGAGVTHTRHQLPGAPP